MIQSAGVGRVDPLAAFQVGKFTHFISHLVFKGLTVQLTGPNVLSEGIAARNLSLCFHRGESYKDEPRLGGKFLEEMLVNI